MRVLHCIASFSGGGAEARLATLCEAAAEGPDSLTFQVAYIAGGPNLDRLEQLPTKLHSLKARSHYDPFIYRQIACIVRNEQIDLVQTWLPMMDVFGGLAAIRNQRPLILSECSGKSLYGDTWKNALRKRVGRRAAGIVANSVQGIDYWRGQVSPDKLHLIPNPVDSRRLRATPPVTDDEYEAVAHGKRLIVYAGRFSAAKNLRRIAETIDLILTERADVSVALFGEGEERSKAEEILHRWIPERVTFMGYTRQLAAWLKRSDVVLSLSKVEGSPNVVLEAAALKVPQVLSDLPQHRAAVGDNGATFCSPDSPREAANAIHAVLDQRGESEARTASAFAKVEGLDPQAILQQYAGLYRRLKAEHV